MRSTLPRPRKIAGRTAVTRESVRRIARIDHPAPISGRRRCPGTIAVARNANPAEEE
jgi:hypothetical protein